MSTSILSHMCMEYKANTLHVKFKTSSKTGTYTEEISDQIPLLGLLKFQVKTEGFNNNNRQIIAFRVIKTYETDHLTYIMEVTSSQIRYLNKTLSCDFRVDDIIENICWQYLYSGGYYTEFDIKITVNILSVANKLDYLREVTELFDFELRGVDGSVKVHKAILAGLSPVMNTMLSGEWKESAEGVVEIANTTKETLQQLKDYMYEQKLPETGIENLATLASYYMMKDLVDCCTFKLLCTLTADNGDELIEFAAKIGMRKLMLSILSFFESGALKSDKLIMKYNE